MASRMKAGPRQGYFRDLCGERADTMQGAQPDAIALCCCMGFTMHGWLQLVLRTWTASSSLNACRHGLGQILTQIRAGPHGHQRPTLTTIRSARRRTAQSMLSMAACCRLTLSENTL